MRLAVLGDIHSNLNALNTVLRDAQEQGVDRILSVGDVVGYGAAPRECIDILRGVEASVVLGNHDAACAGLLDEAIFNPLARDAVLWTRTAIEQEHYDWLEALPLGLAVEGTELVHSSLVQPHTFPYIMEPVDAVPSLDLLSEARVEGLPAEPAKLAFIGHTHVSVVMLRSEETGQNVGWTRDEVVSLGGVTAAVVNAGSVGQPRDGDPRTGYVLVDLEQSTLEFRRMEYDHREEAQRILAAGLPEPLAQRLMLGV